MKSQDITMEKIVTLAKARGFIFQGSEIYGGLANSWDYGPLGAQMKMNIKNSWWNRFVTGRTDVVGLDGAIMMNPKVWEASGHTETFNDPLVEDKITHKRFRADHLLEDNGIDPLGMTIDEMAQAIQDNNITSPEGNELTEPRQFNMMFKTHIGPVESSGNDVFLRPETAQAIFVNFKNVLNTSRKRIPFGIAQIGKAFRNEITPGNFIFRTLEFEQMEIEYFVSEDRWEEHFEKWVEFMEQWAFDIGIKKEGLHRLEVPEADLAHYSKRTIDFEFDYPFGTKELWGLAYRTDHDLASHQRHSGEKMEYTDPDDNTKKYIPHVIEPSLGVDRTLLAVLLSAYDEEEVEGETRTVLRFTPEIAPYQVAVLPLSKKDELRDVAQPIVESLGKYFRVDYDETQSIGKRYRRQDEIGTPFCVTVDFDSLEDKKVTVRNRDTMQQERVAIDDLVTYFKDNI